jgi:hypothetical protein
MYAQIFKVLKGEGRGSKEKDILSEQNAQHNGVLYARNHSTPTSHEGFKEILGLFRDATRVRARAVRP